MEIDRAVKLMIRRKDFSKLICCVERKRIFNRRCILSWNFEKEEANIRRISFREFIVIVWKSRGFGKISSFQNWQAGIDPRSIYSFSNSHFDGTIRSRITGAFSIHRKSDIIDPDRGTGSPRKSLGISFFYSDCCISRLCVDEKKRNKKPRPSMSFLIH